MNLDPSSLFKANLLPDVKTTVKAQGTETVETSETKNELDIRSIMEALTTGCTSVLSQLEANEIEYEQVDTVYGGYTITFEYNGAEYKAEYKTVNDQYNDLLNELNGTEFNNEEEFAEFCGDFYDNLSKEISSENSDYTEYKVSYSKNEKMESVVIRINHEQAAEEEPAANTVSFSDMNGDYKRQYSKAFIESLVDLGVLSDIGNSNYEFDKEKAENILKEFGIEAEGIDDIFSFVGKLPKINEAAGPSSDDKAVYKDHPELFLDGTFGGPYRALNINAVKEFFADCPDLIKTITDASSLQKAIEEKENLESQNARTRGGEPIEEPSSVEDLNNSEDAEQAQEQENLEDIEVPETNVNIFAGGTNEEEPAVPEEPTKTEKPTVAAGPTMTEEPTVVEETAETEKTAVITNTTATVSSQSAAARSTVSTHTEPTEVENMLLLSRGIPESVIAEGVYDIDELLALSSIPGTELYEKCYGMEASWTTENLSYMGFNIDYYLDTYFDKNSDGTYSLKKAATQDGKEGLYVEGEFVSDIQTLKDKLNIISLEDYYNQMNEYNSGNSPSGMVVEWRTITNRQAGVYDYRDYVKKLENREGRSLTNAEIIFLTLIDTAKELNVDFDPFTMLTTDYSNSDRYRISSYMSFRMKSLKNENINHAMMHDNAYQNLSFGSIGDDWRSYNNHATTQEFLTEVVYALEDDNPEKGTFNYTVWNAILEAAGVTDNDDIQTRANKVSGYVQCLKGSENADDLDVFEDLMEKGLLEQNSYQLSELQQLFTQEEIDENFYLATDVSGNSLGVYMLKHDNNLNKSSFYTAISTNLTTEECLEKGIATYSMTAAKAREYGYQVVSTAEELKNALISNPNAKVVLTGDIDMTGIDWIPVGTEDNPFKGNIYGNGYTIRNLNVESSNQYSGLFGVFEGQAFDIKMENCTVKDTRGNDVAGMGGTGVFAGKMSGYGINIQIIDCNVYGRDNAGLLAGIVTGERKDSGARFVLNSYEKLALENCKTSGYVYSEYAAGGIAGMYDGTGGNRIYDCDSSAEVNGQVWAGGILGQTENAYGFNAWNGTSQVSIASLIDKCDFTGASINKDIKNPPGAMGAGVTAGRMSISDDIYKAIEDQLKVYEQKYGKDTETYNSYVASFIPAVINNMTSSLVNTQIYNTYASGYRIGWLCTLNDDGSVKETQKWFRDLSGAVTTGYDPTTDRYVTIIHGRDCSIGKCDGFDAINENDIAENQTPDYYDTELYNGKPHYIVHNGSGSFGAAAKEADSFNRFASHISDIVKDAPDGKFASGASKESVEEQEQFIADPTYVDVVKEVILQNFVEHYDVNNPVKRLVLDQLGNGEYLTRANYKELIDEVKARTGLTDEELIKNTIDKLLAECINMDVTPNQLENGWLSSLIAATDGVVYSRPSKEGAVPENAYIETSTPAQMRFYIEDTHYLVTFDSDIPPEFISTEELRTKLQEAGASESDIEKIIQLYYEEAVSTHDYKTDKTNIYTYYFSGSHANTWHSMYCSFFKSTEDFENFFTGNDDPYTHYWNSLSLDENFRSQVQDLYSGDEETGGSLQNVVRSDDSKYTIFAGLFNYTEYVLDKDGNRVTDKNGKNKSKQTLCIWNPYTKKIERTNIPASCVSSNGTFDIAEARKYCSDSKILELISMYVRHQVPKV